MRSLIFLLLAFWTVQCFAETDSNAQPCPTPFTAKLVSLQGKLSVDAQGTGQWQPAHLDDSFCEGSRIQVDTYSRASLLLPDHIILRLDEGTVLTLNGIDNNKPTLLALLKGFVHFISRTPKHLEITSPIANAGPEGTEFAMRVDSQNAALWVYEGGVKFFNRHGSVHLLPGQAAQAHTGQAPSPQLTIKPQDAVNWALYYPPILPYPHSLTGIDTNIGLAIQEFRQGHSDVALSMLANLPPDKQTVYYLKVRAAMLLSVGREQLARQDIDTLLTKQPNDAEALALQSVLALTQNRKDEAYQLAKQAIAADGKSATAYSALSYAEQGRFALDNALTAAQQATQLAPHDAMAWARQAELELALGLSSQSAKTAQHAIGLDANLERTQTVMGFADLLHTDTDAALQRFTQAVRLDSSAPLARLGLGLSKIRQGDLAQGRQDLEIAAILDPNNSLIRSYLGKAYYEEKRNALAGEQFDLAKQRDPKDPTPYFYEAIKKQTENRPVEALEELQKSTALNDNRAVYRSKQLLDQDKAIRGTSVARIFNTLGLEKRALVEASKSLSLEPADASSHRFLSDAYVNVPRQGIAHVSELLQAQLLQPVNINPIQPHLSVTGLGSISGIGPAEAGFKDFTHTFDRDQPQLTTSGVIGDKNTYADEAVLSGIYKKMSYSLGQFHYQTDGFRPNADVEQNIYDAFIQTELTDKLNLQFEYRKQIVNQGDQALSLIPDPAIKREGLDLESARTGLHALLTPSSHLLASFIYSKRIENVKIDDSNQNIFEFDSRDGYTGEIQLITNFDRGNLTIGGGAYHFNSNFQSHIEQLPTPFCNLFPELCEKKQVYSIYPSFSGQNVYGYTNVYLKPNVIGTIGGSYTNYDTEKPSVKSNTFSPKFGLQWNLTEQIRIRAAYFETLKRMLAADQTIEPTQIAGFNQLFDDFNGTKADFFGAALDGTITNKFYGGYEFNYRQLNHLYLSQLQNNIDYVSQTEERHRSYIYWSPISNIALKIEFQNEKQSGRLLKINTYTLPLTVKYFASNGFYVDLKNTLVWQKEYANKLSSEFSVVDAVIGYRLPKRLGIVAFEVRNIFDTNFKFQDLSTVSSDRFSIQSPFLPSRTLFARVTINF